MCIFCDIVNGKSPCFKIWKNDDFLAFFDIFPNTKGQTIVVPKKHYDSDLFTIDDGKFYKEYFLSVQEVVNLIKK